MEVNLVIHLNYSKKIASCEKYSDKLVVKVMMDVMLIIGKRN